MQVTLPPPSSNRTCRFPASGLPENLCWRHARRKSLGTPTQPSSWRDARPKPILWEQCSMLNDSPLTTIQIRQGSFARPALPGVLTTMNPSDSPRCQGMVIDSHRLLAGRRVPSVRLQRRVSQVPWLICRRPPPPLTPGSPTVALARCFAVGMRLRHLWKDGRSQWFNEAETGSRFRITADAFAFQGFRRSDYSITCSVGYMANEHLPWSVPFN